MPLLTRTLLEDLGVHLSDADYESLADHFDTTLNERVIDEIVAGLTPEQAQELANLQQSDDTTVLQWLQTNVTDLSDIVSDEIDILLGELAESSEALDAQN